MSRIFRSFNNCSTVAQKSLKNVINNRTKTKKRPQEKNIARELTKIVPPRGRSNSQNFNGSELLPKSERLLFFDADGPTLIHKNHSVRSLSHMPILATHNEAQHTFFYI